MTSPGDEDRHPWPQKLLDLPARSRLILLAGFTLAYGLALVLFQPFLGTAGTIFSLVPVLAGSWLFGLWPGLLNCSVQVLITELLLRLFFPANSSPASSPALISSIIGLVIGSVAIGWLHELYIQLNGELAERRKTEQALRQSETRLRQFIEQSSDAVMLIDESGIVIAWNSAMETLTSLPVEKTLGQPAIDIWLQTVAPERRTPEWIDRFHYQLSEFLRKGYSRNAGSLIERVVYRPDGSTVTAQENTITIRTEHGFMYASLLRDISTEKKVEAALRASEERWRTYFEQATDLIFTLDSKGRIAAVNQASFVTLGYEPEEMIGKSLVDLVSPEYRRLAQLMLQDVQGGRGGETIEIEALTQDGCSVYLEVRSQPIYENSNLSGSLHIARNVTQRRRAENALRNSETLFHSLVDTMPISLFRRDRQGRLIFANRLYCRGFNRTLEEMLGQNDYDIHPVPLADKFWADDLFVMESGEKLETEESRQVLGSDELEIVHVIKTPIFAEDGKVVGLQGIFWDVTENRRMEEAERQQRQLAEALRDSANLLNSSLEFDQVIEQILANLERVVPHESAVFFHLENGTAIPKRVFGRDETYRKITLEQTLKLSDTPTMAAMHTSGRPLLIAETENFADWRRNVQGTDWIRSFLGVPLRSQGQTVGFLCLTSSRPDFFSSAHAERLEAFASQAAIAIQNANLFGEMQRYARRTALINDLTRLTVSAPNLHNMLERVTDRLGELFEANAAFLTLWDAEQRTPIPAAAYGPSRELFPRLHFKPGDDTLTLHILQAGRVLAIDDVAKSAYAQNQSTLMFPAASSMGLPLITDGRWLGAAMVSFSQPHRFSTDEISLGGQVAAQLALAIARFQLLEVEKQRTGQLTRANSFISALGQVAARVEMATGPERVMETLGIELEKLGIHCLVALCDNAPERLARGSGSTAPSNNRPNQAEIDGISQAEGFLPAGETADEHSHSDRSLSLKQALTSAGRPPAPVEPSQRSQHRIEPGKRAASSSESGWSGGRKKPAAQPEALFIHYLSLGGEAVAAAEKLVGMRFSDYRFPVDRFPFYDQVSRHHSSFSAEGIAVTRELLPGVPLQVVKRLARLMQVTPTVGGIFLPLSAQDQIIGTLWLWGEGLEASDLPAASIFASQVGVSLEKSRLYSEVQQLAITDELTGIYNRRGLFELGRREIERAARFNRSLSAMMIDLDHFKAVNDRYGHPTGDIILRVLAERFRRNVRDIDILGRYGGEEFVILLPETDLDTALQVAERLRCMIEVNPIFTDWGAINITASFGVSGFSENIHDLSDLVEATDRALYQAKRSGRNRVNTIEDQT